MGRSRGQIQKRGKGKYLVRVYLGRVDGKRKYKSKTVNGSEEDAEKKLTEMLRKKDRGMMARPESGNVAEFMDEWLEMKKGKVAAKTWKNYRDDVKNHIKPDLGHVRLEDLHSRLIQAWVNDLGAEKGLAPGSVRNIHTVLRSALKQAVIWEMIPVNPAGGGRIELPSPKKREYRILTKEEAREFLRVTAEDRFHVIWALLLSTGLRPQEVIALKWEDLDENGFLYVRRVVKRMSVDHRDLQVSNDMKTDSSRRRIKVPEFVIRKLESHKADQAGRILEKGSRYERNGFMFDNGLGCFLDPKVLRDDFKNALKKSGLPSEIRLYDLRHTHISHLIIDGVDLKKASSRAGHSSIKLTADTYAHLDDSAEEEMAESTAAAFQPVRTA